jgi:hypothetical protein
MGSGDPGATPEREPLNQPFQQQFRYQEILERDRVLFRGGVLDGMKKVLQRICLQLLISVAAEDGGDGDLSQQRQHTLKTNSAKGDPN